MISQIDNMHAGVVAENERMRAALLRMANMPMPEYNQDDAHRLRHVVSHEAKCRVVTPRELLKSIST